MATNRNTITTPPPHAKITAYAQRVSCLDASQACDDLGLHTVSPDGSPSHARRRRSDTELACLYRLGQHINQSLELDEVATIALDIVLEAVKPDVALLFIQKGERLMLHKQIDRPGHGRAVTVPLHKVGHCLCGLAVEKRRPIYSLDMRDDPRCTMDECLQAGVISFAALPLCLENCTLGVLALAAQAKSRDFSAQAKFLETMAGQIAAALRNAQLHGEVRQRSRALAQSVAHLEREIAERKMAEEALRRGATRLESIFRTSPVGIGLVVNRTLMEVNDRICEMTGRGKQELIGQSAAILYPSQMDFDFVGREKYRQISEKGIGTVETHWRSKDGAIIDVLLSSVPLDPRHLENGVTFSALDITERKAAVDQIHRLNAELEQRVTERTAELAGKNRELETFTYSVSHDLKAPLRAIEGYSRLLLEEYGPRLDENATLFLRSIRSGTDQMNRLIDGLLAYARIDRRQPVHRTMDLPELITEIVSKYHTDIETRGMVVSMELDARSVVTDGEGLGVALRNLFDNAVKFSQKSARPTIVIGSRPTETGLVVWVRDNGKGFDMRHHDRIFDIFQRLERAEEYPGTGIGLSMVRKAAERMGGRCWAESEPERGATFYLEIPQ
jgi:PAS domain S-box-containing protein